MSGVEKEKMSTMDTAFCVMWKYDVTMVEKHNCWSIVHKRNTKKWGNILKTKVKQNLRLLQSASLKGPSTSTSELRPLGLFTVGDATLEAEIFWLAKVASCNYSLQSTDHIGDLFRKMFPDSKIAENFKLSHTSASYIIGHTLLVSCHISQKYLSVIFQILNFHSQYTLMKPQVVRWRNRWM